jgi:hypothetical protein
MNANLTKYLSDVFRNEVEHDATLEAKESSLQQGSHVLDRNIKQFVVDKRFSLHLDEIV